MKDKQQQKFANFFTFIVVIIKNKLQITKKNGCLGKKL